MLLEHQAKEEKLDEMELLENLVEMGVMVHLESVVKRVTEVQMVLMVSAVVMAEMVLMDLLDLMDNLVKMAHLACQVLMEPLAQLVREVHKEKEEIAELWGKMVLPVQPGNKEQLVKEARMESEVKLE